MRRWPRFLRKLDWWWERAYRAIGGGGFSIDPDIEANWPEGFQLPVQGRLHPFKMRLNLKDWLERRAYFSGQLYQRDLEKVITTILRKGDCFIDIGANIGLVSLLAASRIGKSGRLIAVEANPAVFARLKGHLESNPLGMPIIALNLALGDSSSAAFMHVSSAHTGTGTLTLGQGSVPVSIEPADRVIAIPDDDQPVCIKIDVEGYECRVLKGMSKLLSRRDVALIVEVSRDMLVRIGDSSKSLHELLAAAGFSCYLIRHRIGRWGESLRFERTDCALDEWQYDAIYVKPGSSFERRMMPYAR